MEEANRIPNPDEDTDPGVDLVPVLDDLHPVLIAKIDRDRGLVPTGKNQNILLPIVIVTILREIQRKIKT